MRSSPHLTECLRCNYMIYKNLLGTTRLCFMQCWTTKKKSRIYWKIPLRHALYQWRVMEKMLSPVNHKRYLAWSLRVPCIACQHAIEKSHRTPVGAILIAQSQLVNIVETQVVLSKEKLRHVMYHLMSMPNKHWWWRKKIWMTWIRLKWQTLFGQNNNTGCGDEVSNYQRDY